MATETWAVYLAAVVDKVEVLPVLIFITTPYTLFHRQLPVGVLGRHS
jgi:hypothetical protein